LAKKPKKEEKTPPDSGKLAIRPDHPRRRIEVKVCMPGSVWCVVLHRVQKKLPMIFLL